MKKVVGAFDIGATNARIVIADSRGKIISRAEKKTSEVEGKDLPKLVGDALEECMVKTGNKKLAAIAGSQAGLIDSERIIVYSPNIKDCKDVNIGGYLKKRFKTKVKLHNDGSAAALGVLKLDARAKGMKNIIYVIMGSGIGGGIIINGQVFSGANGFAGEIGHTVIKAGGNECSCGNKGCWEAYCSGLAIAKIANRQLYKYDKGVLLKFPNIRAEHVFQAAKQGDDLAKRIVEEVGYYNSIAVANLVNIFDPEAIFFGESILENEAEILDPIRKNISNMIMGRAPKIYKTNVKEPGLHGAIFAAIELVKNN